MKKSLKVLLIVFGIIIVIVGFFLFLNFKSSPDNFYISFKDLSQNNESLNLEKAQTNNSFHLVKQDKWKVIKSTDDDFEIKIKDDKNKNSEICLVLKDGKDTGKYKDKNLYTKDGLKEAVKKQKDKDNKDSYCFTCPEGYCKLGEHSTIFEWISDNLEVRDLNNNLIAEYERVENTDSCLVDCYTIFKVTLYTDNSIFDGYDFVNINNYNTEVDYNVYILKDKWRIKQLDNYTQSCINVFANNTNNEVCQSLNNPYEINETYSEYEPYNNEQVNSGEYYIKVSGKKKPSVSVDLSVSAFGISTEEFRQYWTWWNSSFEYKKEIQVEEMSGKDQKQYQLRLNVTKTSDMNRDYSDLRFLDSTESIELNYYLWNYTENSALIDVKGNWTTGTNTTIYMYYGNPSATSKSNGSLTYYYFYDFESDTPTNTPSGWVSRLSSGGRQQVVNFLSYSRVNALNVNDTVNGLSTTITSDVDSVYSQGKYMFNYKTLSGTSDELFGVTTTAGYQGTYFCGYPTVSQTGGVYKTYEFQFNSSDLYRTVLNGVSGSFNNFVHSGDCGAFAIFTFSANIINTNHDNFAVANWTYPEPIYTIGIEESNNLPPQIYITEPLNNTNYSSDFSVVYFIANATDDLGLLGLSVSLLNLSGYLSVQTQTNSTPNQLNISLDSGGGFLDDGRYWLWYNATDKNLVTNRTENITILFDSHAPEFTYIPPNATLTYGLNNLNVNFTINDTNQITGIEGIGINQINVNDSRFTINSSGWLNNNTILGVGIYIINISVNDSLNNENSRLYKVTVNQATPSLFITGTTPLTYGTITDVAGTNCPTQLSCSLNMSNAIYSAGIHQFNYSTSGNTNYTSNSTTIDITINQANSEVNTYINNSRSNLTITLSDSIYLNGSKVTGEGNIYLYNNGTLINSGLNSIFNLTLFSNMGMYNISTIYQNTQNYTESIETFWLNFTDKIPPVITNLANLTAYINTPFTYTFTATDDSGISNFWLNDTTNFNINNSGYFYNSSNLLSTGIYYLMISVNDTLNNVANYNFSITITTSPVSTSTSTNSCLYKKFGYYNLNLPYFNEINCI